MLCYVMLYASVTKDFCSAFSCCLQENIECDIEPVTSSPAPMVLMFDSPPATAVRIFYHVMLGVFVKTACLYVCNFIPILLCT